MKKYTKLFFDFDGTLTNTYEGVEKILDMTFAHYGYNIDKARYTQFIGPPLSTTFAEIFGGDKAYEAVDFFRKNYIEQNAIYQSKVYDGIEQCLKSLKQKGYMINVATCKKQEEAEHLLDYFGLKKYIDFVSGLCYNVRETKAEVLGYAIDKLGLDTQDCLMIGDTKYDVEGAEQLSIDCILCLWGFGDYNKIHNKNVVARLDKPMEIVDFLDKQ